MYMWLVLSLLFHFCTPHAQRHARRARWDACTAWWPRAYALEITRWGVFIAITANTFYSFLAIDRSVLEIIFIGFHLPAIIWHGKLHVQIYRILYKLCNCQSIDLYICSTSSYDHNPMYRLTVCIACLSAANLSVFHNCKYYSYEPAVYRLVYNWDF